jgi:hypothetical protein
MGQGGGLYIYYGNNYTINAVISNNSSTGGVFYISGNNNVFSGSLINNKEDVGINLSGSDILISNAVVSGQGGRGIIAGWYSDNVSIINSIFTNNQINMSLMNNVVGPLNVLISNNLIGGNNSFGGGYGMYEGDWGTNDCYGFKLLNNIFITNNLDFLYYDIVQGAASIDEINKVNTPSYSGAVQAYGNIVTNY